MTTEKTHATSSDLRIGDWVIQHGEHESCCVHPSLGEHLVASPIRDYWRDRVARLGPPRGHSEDIVVGDRQMRIMDFEGGTIVLDVRTGTLLELATGGRPSFDLVSHLPLFVGSWDTPFARGTVGSHAVLLHTNEVLFLSYQDSPDGDSVGGVAQHGEWSVLDLSTGAQSPRTVRDRSQFCGGHCLLDDGIVFVAGGDRHNPVNHKSVSLYDTVNRRWLRLPDLTVGRWYPTIVAVGGSQAVVVGGDDAAEQYEGDHRANPSLELISRRGRSLRTASFDPSLTADGSTYPFVFVLPEGKLFVHFGADSCLLNVNTLDFATAERIPAIDRLSRTYPSQGTAVLLPLRPHDTSPYRARIMTIGGGNGLSDARLPARADCEILDLGEEPHHWRSAARMTHPRAMPDAVLLPDGTVLVVNGTRFGSTGSGRDPVYEAELYDPALDRWYPLARMTIERLYHATALLLPDARVLVAGTDSRFNADFNYAHDLPEVFSPPYLHAGPRPVIWRAPVELTYGELFRVEVNNANAVKSVVLIRNGSCTHSFNSDQRFVELEILGKELDLFYPWYRWVDTGGAYPVYSRPRPGMYPRVVRLKAPPDRHVAPPGYYMLFAVSASGVPSVAEFVRLDDARGLFQRVASGIASVFAQVSVVISGLASRVAQRAR